MTLEFPTFPASPVRSKWPALLGQSTGPSLCFPGSGDALALRNLLLPMPWCSGVGLELWTPSSLRWPWCRLGTQAGNPEEGPSSSRMHENAAGNRGLQGALGVEGRI